MAIVKMRPRKTIEDYLNLPEGARAELMDALHLASVLVFQAETELRLPFITGDAQQQRAAEALGLNVVFVG